jgi:His-Xaa-Ser system protein HxsD
MATKTPPVVAWRLDDAHLAVPVDLTVYSLDATIRAAYKLTDRCFIFLQRDLDHDTSATLYLLGRSPSSDLRQVALEFQNELLDQQLRCQLEAQFGDVRTLITAQAFSEANLIDPEADAGDYDRDPLGAGTHR